MFASLAVMAFLGFEIEIRELIEQMDNPSFRVRENAVKSIASFGRFSVPVLKKARKEHRSKEFRHGCKMALEIVHRGEFYTLHPDWFPKFKKYPRLELIYEFTGSTLVSASERQKNLRWPSSFPISWNRAGMYLHDAKDKTPGDSPKFEYQRLATKWYVRDLLDAGMPREEVLEFVNRLTEMERRWYLKYDFVPPELKEPPVKK
jgi:hypothetical protein